jgi:hypothetical protein
MPQPHTESFDVFVERFVRCYWTTVKAQKFSMPPNEPVEESVEEILAGVATSTEKVGPDHVLVMRSGDWAWWKYVFRRTADGWVVTEASARSLDRSAPHDFLAPPYDQYFRPFLIYVTQCSNSGSPESQA